MSNNIELEQVPFIETEAEMEEENSMVRPSTEECTVTDVATVRKRSIKTENTEVESQSSNERISDNPTLKRNSQRSPKRLSESRFQPINQAKRLGEAFLQKKQLADTYARQVEIPTFSRCVTPAMERLSSESEDDEPTPIPMPRKLYSEASTSQDVSSLQEDIALYPSIHESSDDQGTESIRPATFSNESTTSISGINYLLTPERVHFEKRPLPALRTKSIIKNILAQVLPP